jgi:hypothetical protein
LETETKAETKTETQHLDQDAKGRFFIYNSGIIDASSKKKKYNF